MNTTAYGRHLIETRRPYLLDCAPANVTQSIWFPIGRHSSKGSLRPNKRRSWIITVTSISEVT